jgi:hypothetical protein
MNLVNKIKSKLNDGLTTFKWFERTIATVCIAIPFFLWVADDQEQFRSSISKYVNMPRSYIFGMLLCAAAMLFIFNGAVYFRKEDDYNINSHGKWYNVVLGVSLLGVILFRYDEWGILHNILAGIFFLGSALVIGIFHQKKDRKISITLAAITFICIALAFIPPKPISIFWGEWLSFSVIAVHFILESKGEISLDKNSLKKK